MTPRVAIPPSQLFPVPQETPEVCLHTFEAFDSDQLEFIAGSNEGLTDSTDPIAHLLSYKEEPLLSLARDEGFLEPSPTNGTFYAAQRYRAGVCIGASIIRTRIDECAEAGRALPEMHVDPERRYLSYPEEKTGDNFLRYYAERRTGPLSVTYLEPAVERRYFAGQQSVADVYALERAWEQRGMDFLLKGGVSPEEMFGEVCRGMFHTFRLYRMLEREARLAPWEEKVYNPTKHRLLDQASPLDVDHTSSSVDRVHMFRRWQGGLVARGRHRFRGMTFDRLGDTILIPDTKVMAVRRCLTGYVQVDAAHPGASVQVAYRNSIEEYAVRPDDTFILRDSAGGYRTMGGSERTPQVPNEIVALCRGKEAIMLSDLHGEPMSESLTHILTMQLASDAYV